MMPAQFHAEQQRMGWLAMVSQTYDLRPAEGRALERLTRHPGATVTHAQLSGGTSNAGRLQVERLRRKLEDAGCQNAIRLVYGEGYVIDLAGIAAIDVALRFAWGVDAARDGAVANNAAPRAA